MQDKETAHKDRHSGQDDEAQLPIDGEHDDKHAEECEEVPGDGQWNVGEGILQDLGIAGQFRQELTGLRV